MTRHHAALATVAGLALFTTACSTSSSTPRVDQQGAAVMCEQFMKKRLKSPGSADFAGVFDTKIKTLHDSRPWRYKVTAYVDSDNSFGAKVRTDYVCTISTKDNDTWTLENLDVNQR